MPNLSQTIVNMDKIYHLWWVKSITNSTQEMRAQGNWAYISVFMWLASTVYHSRLHITFSITFLSDIFYCNILYNISNNIFSQRECYKGWYWGSNHIFLFPVVAKITILTIRMQILRHRKQENLYEDSCNILHNINLECKKTLNKTHQKRRQKAKCFIVKEPNCY